LSIRIRQFIIDRVWIPFRLRLKNLHQDFLVFSCETQVDSKSIADPGSGAFFEKSESDIRDEHPISFYRESLEAVSRVSNTFDADADLLTRDPGWKYSDPV
jgi:hypothetical protein